MTYLKVIAAGDLHNTTYEKRGKFLVIRRSHKQESYHHFQTHSIDMKRKIIVIIKKK